MAILDIFSDFLLRLVASGDTGACDPLALVQFHPELKSRPLDPHPLFKSFIAAAKEQSRLV
jgi:carbamoylphosphate synthase small subunit